MRSTSKAGTALVVLCCIVPAIAHGHGFAGKRFFPATLATDDPFVHIKDTDPPITAIAESSVPPWYVL